VLNINFKKIIISIISIIFITATTILISSGLVSFANSTNSQNSTNTKSNTTNATIKANTTAKQDTNSTKNSNTTSSNSSSSKASNTTSNQTNTTSCDLSNFTGYHYEYGVDTPYETQVDVNLTGIKVKAPCVDIEIAPGKYIYNFNLNTTSN